MHQKRMGLKCTNPFRHVHEQWQKKQKLIEQYTQHRIYQLLNHLVTCSMLSNKKQTKVGCILKSLIYKIKTLIFVFIIYNSNILCSYTCSNLLFVGTGLNFRSSIQNSTPTNWHTIFFTIIFMFFLYLQSNSLRLPRACQCPPQAPSFISPLPIDRLQNLPKHKW